jgi:hypothetical protein
MRTPLSGTSLSTFTGFVSATVSTRARKYSSHEDDGMVDEVLFDEDERGGFHSRLGTEESSSSPDEA